VPPQYGSGDTTNATTPGVYNIYTLNNSTHAPLHTNSQFIILEKNNQQRNNGVKMIGNLDPFEGNPEDDAAEWLPKFLAACTANKWMNDSVKAMQLPVFLSNTAKKWHDALPSETQNNWELLSNKFVNQFKGQEKINRAWAQLKERKQQPNEILDHYIFAQEEIFNKLRTNISEDQKLRIFLEGLHPVLQAKVVESNPTSYSRAVVTARKKEHAMRTLMSLYTTESRNPPPLINYIPQVQSPVPVQINQPVVESPVSTTAVPENVAATIKELKDQIQLLQQQTIQNQQQDILNFIDYRTHRGGRRGNFRGRYRRSIVGRYERDFIQDRINQMNGNSFRTADGQVICRQCLKVGHYQRNCPENQETKPAPRNTPKDNNDNYNNNREEYNPSQGRGRGTQFRGRPRGFPFPRGRGNSTAREGRPTNLHNLREQSEEDNQQEA